MYYLSRSAAPTPAEAPYLSRIDEKSEWKYGLKKHAEALHGIKGLVDQSVPKSINPPAQIIQAHSRRFSEEQRRVEIARENRKLVERLESISKGMGDADPRAPPRVDKAAVAALQGLPKGAVLKPVRPSEAAAALALAAEKERLAHRPPGGCVTADGHRSLNEPYRKKTQRGIDSDNAGLVRRILSTGSTIDPRMWQRDFQRHKRTVQLLQRLPDRGTEFGEGKKKGQPRSLPPLRAPRPAGRVSAGGLEGLFLPGSLRRSATGGDLFESGEMDMGGGSSSGAKTFPRDPYSYTGGFYSSADEEIKRRVGDGEESQDEFAPFSRTLGAHELDAMPPGSPSASSAGLGVRSKSGEGSLGMTAPTSADADGSISVASGGTATQRDRGSSIDAAAPLVLGELEALRANSGAFSPQRDQNTERRRWEQREKAEPGTAPTSPTADGATGPGGEGGATNSPGNVRHHISGMSTKSDLQYDQEWDENSFSAASPSRTSPARSRASPGNDGVQSPMSDLFRKKR